MQRALGRTWSGEEATAVKNQIKADLAAELTSLAKAGYWWSYRLRWQATVDDYVDGLLNTLIARYGPENGDVIRRRLKQRAGTLRHGVANLVDVLDEVVADLPEAMRTEGNLANLKRFLFGLREGAALDDDDMLKQTPDEVRKRWRSIRDNVVLAETRVRRDWKRIQKGFRIKGALAFVHMTGSDFHNRGQSVAFAESDRGEKVVYKPRSLSPDMALMGDEGSVFAALNERGQGHVSLPTASFDPRDDEAGEYGYMEFLGQAKVLSQEAAESYYFRLGQVAVASKLLGVTDLHQENVLTGNGAPFIIDAETSFLPYVMLRDSFKSTGLDAALGSFEKLGKATPNAFLTVDEDKQWRKVKLAKPDANWHSFVTKKRREVVAGKGGSLTEAMKMGVLRMLEFIARYREPLVADLLERATAVEHVRVVPLDTLEFNGFLGGYHMPRDNPSDVYRFRRRIVELAIQGIADELTGFGFQLVEGHQAILLQGLIRDFAQKDVPIFHYEPSEEAVYYGTRLVGRTRKGFTLREAIPEVVRRLTRTTVEDVFKSYLAS